MANPNSSGPGQPRPDDDHTSWRPADDEQPADRDDDRKQQSTERDGQGQSGYSAGRRAEDAAQRFQNRNERGASEADEDQHNKSGMGLDDRFDRSERPAPAAPPSSGPKGRS